VTAVIFCMGVTCSGKTTWIDKQKNVGKVQVGKEMRKLFPPGYFKGRGAMTETEEVALRVFQEQFEKEKHNLAVLVDGQPRLVSQIDPILDITGKQCSVMWFQASDDELLARLRRRFPDDSESYDLAIQRMKNDRIQLYDVLHELISRNILIFPVRSEHVST
jgi:hypothetical protein